MRGDSDHEADPRGPLDPQHLWQAQKKEYDPVTLAQIHTQALAFEKTVQRRNAREYLSIGVGVVAMSAAAALLPHMTLMMRAGAVGMVMGLAIMAWQLYRRASPEATPQYGETLAETYRRQLIRQRDAGRTGFWWYILPTIPGLTLMVVGIWLKGPAPGPSGLARFYISMPIVSVAVVGAYAWSVLYIRHGVRRLQKMIDDL